MNKFVGLDTNCLLQSLSHRSRYYHVWETFILGKYTLCITTEILEEYEEIIASHMSPLAAKLVTEGQVSVTFHAPFPLHTMPLVRQEPVPLSLSVTQ